MEDPFARVRDQCPWMCQMWEVVLGLRSTVKRIDNFHITPAQWPHNKIFVAGYADSPKYRACGACGDAE